MTDRTIDPILDPDHEDDTGDEHPNDVTSPAGIDATTGEDDDQTWSSLAGPEGTTPGDDLAALDEPFPVEPEVADVEDEFPDQLTAESSFEPGEVNEPGRALPPPIAEPLPVGTGDEEVAAQAMDAASAESEVSEPVDEAFVPLTASDTTEAFEPSGPEGATAGSDAVPEASTPGQPESRTAGATAAASGFLGSLKDRFRAIGSGSSEPDAEPDEKVDPGQASTTSWSTRMGTAVRGYFDPRLAQYTTRPHRWLLGISAVVILLSLLAGSGGLALVMLSVIAPLLIVVTLTQLDVFEKESNLIVAGVIAAGAIAGIVLGAIASWIQGEQWFDTGKLNFGAGGFSGPFAEAAGSLPVVVWLVSGVVLGAVGTAAIGGAAVALRQFPQFRNEAMDSIIIAGAAAAGYAIGLSLVYWWPMVGDPGPVTSVQDWTLRIIGVGILRPATFTLCGALLGFGVWLYATKRSFSVAGVPAMMGGLGLFLLGLVPTTLQASGSWSEVIVTAILFAVAFPAYRFALDNAIAIDRQALGDEGNRIVCPACHKVTPMGDFCAHCGQRLGATAEQEMETAPGG